MILPFNHSSNTLQGTHNNQHFQNNGFHHADTALSQSAYYLTSNISISDRSSYKITNTRLIVTGNYSIEDSGTFSIINSTVIEGDSYDHLSVMVNGSRSYPATLNMSDSRYCVPGSIAFLNATGSFINSTITSGYRNVSNSQESLTFSAVYSNIFSYNSTFTGLIRTNSSFNYTGGYESFNRTIPFSSSALIPLNYRNGTGEDPLITGINISMQYSGNNPSGTNSLQFTYFGLNYTFYLGSTGSVFTYEHACFTIPVKKPFMSVLNYSENLKAEMHIYSETGSNSTIKTLCIKYNSNDTVSYYGNTSFSYSIRHSDAVYVNSTLEFDRNNPYSYLNLQNPEHDYLDALNSSVYFADSRSYSGSGDFPYYIKNSSTIFCLFYVGISFYDQENMVTNFTVSVNSQSNNSTIDYENSFVNSLIILNRIQTGYVNNSFYETYLLSDLISFNDIIYTNEYRASLYGKNFTISLPPYNFSKENKMIEDFQINLPGVVINPSTTGVEIGENNLINFQIKDYLSPSLNFNYSLSFYNNTNLIAETANQSCYLSGGESIQKNYSIAFPDFIANKTELIITVNSGEPTIHGINFTEIYYLDAFVNASLEITSGYSWTHDDSKMSLAINVTGYSGAENSALKIMISSYPVQGITFNRTFTTSPCNFSIVFQCNLSFGATPNNITITATLSSNVLIYIHGYSKQIVSIEKNASYFPVSTILYRETGLPSGISWGIYLNGTSYSSFGDTISIQVTNGEYNFTVRGVPDYVSNISSGTVNAIFEKECINLSFTQHLYSVRIHETGLPDNYSWSVSYGTENFTANGNCIDIQVPNGTYFLLAAAIHFSSGNISYPVTVNGYNLTVQVKFNAAKTGSTFSLVIDRITQSPFTYIIILISLLLYVRLYKGSTLLCSKCLQPTGHFKRKCKCDISNSKYKEG